MKCVPQSPAEPQGGGPQRPLGRHLSGALGSMARKLPGRGWVRTRARGSRHPGRGRPHLRTLRAKPPAGSVHLQPRGSASECKAAPKSKNKKGGWVGFTFLLSGGFCPLRRRYPAAGGGTRGFGGSGGGPPTPCRPGNRPCTGHQETSRRGLPGTPGSLGPPAHRRVGGAAGPAAGETPSRGPGTLPGTVCAPEPAPPPNVRPTPASPGWPDQPGLPFAQAQSSGIFLDASFCDTFLKKHSESPLWPQRGWGGHRP